MLRAYLEIDRFELNFEEELALYRQKHHLQWKHIFADCWDTSEAKLYIREVAFHASSNYLAAGYAKGDFRGILVYDLVVKGVIWSWNVQGAGDLFFNELQLDFHPVWPVMTFALPKASVMVCNFLIGHKPLLLDGKCRNMKYPTCDPH